MPGSRLHQVFVQFCRVVCFVEKFPALRALVPCENGFYRNTCQKAQHAPAGILVLTHHKRVVAIMSAGAFFQLAGALLLLHLSRLLNLRLHSKNFLSRKKGLCQRLGFIEQFLHVLPQAVGKIFDRCAPVAALVGHNF